MDGADRRPLEGKLATRLERVRAHVLEHLPCFARQGAVVAGWRTHQGRRLGPYFRLVYRAGGRQRTMYLGSSQALAQRVRELLATLQKPNRELRAMRRLTTNARADMRRTKAQLRQHLASVGITLKGWELRGARRFLQTRRELQTLLGAVAAARSSDLLGTDTRDF